MSLQPETCFACGTANPHGMHMTFSRLDSGEVLGTFTPTLDHEGWPGIVHGGILVTALDEAMAYALWFSDYRAVTVRMDVRFRRSLAAGETVNVTASVTEERRGVIDATARMVRPSGEVVAEATGRFMPADVSY